MNDDLKFDEGLTGDERMAALEAARPGSPAPNILTAPEAAELVFALARFIDRHGPVKIETGEFEKHGRRQYGLYARCTGCGAEESALITLWVASRIEVGGPGRTARLLRDYARELLGRSGRAPRRADA